MGSVGLREWQLTASTWKTLWELGDFLPLVDPEDTASWGILLQDLGEAAVRGGPKLRHDPPPGNPWWVSALRRAQPGWVVDITWGQTALNTRSFGPYASPGVSDRAEALIRARGLLR